MFQNSRNKKKININQTLSSKKCNKIIKKTINENQSLGKTNVLNREKSAENFSSKICKEKLENQHCKSNFVQ